MVLLLCSCAGGSDDNSFTALKLNTAQAAKAAVPPQCARVMIRRMITGSAQHWGIRISVGGHCSNLQSV